MENTTDPETGCPSSEMTRQLRICVPRPRSAGAAISTVPSLSSNRSSACEVPSGRTSAADKSETGSLKVSARVEGAAASIEPSRGWVATSDACAWAVAPSHIQASIMATASVAERENSPFKLSAPCSERLARRNAPAAIDQWPAAFSSSLMPGAGVSSSSSAWPAAGISIQRSTAPSGHSCTTGK